MAHQNLAFQLARRFESHRNCNQQRRSLERQRNIRDAVIRVGIVANTARNSAPNRLMRFGDLGR